MPHDTSFHASPEEQNCGTVAQTIVWGGDYSFEPWLYGPGTIVLGFSRMAPFKPIVWCIAIQADGELGGSTAPWEGPIPPIRKGAIEDFIRLARQDGLEINEADLGWLHRFVERDEIGGEQ
jgi:hypothetical protein